jgi:hypothetical protein
VVKRYARIAQTDCAKALQKASPVDDWRLQSRAVEEAGFKDSVTVITYLAETWDLTDRCVLCYD